MGFFRFRRSIGIIPGVRLNFGKKSASLSLGVRGLHYTVGTAGKRITVGLPGSGLSYTHKFGSGVSSPNPALPSALPSAQTQTAVGVFSPPPAQHPGVQTPAILAVPRTQKIKTVLGWLWWSVPGVALIAAACWAATIIGH
jgi:hypothetical protein